MNLPNRTWKGEHANEPDAVSYVSFSLTVMLFTILMLYDDYVDCTAEGCWIYRVPCLGDRAGY